MIPSLGFLRPTPCGGLPVELGGRSRMRESPEELRDRVHREVESSLNGVPHHLFWRH